MTTHYLACDLGAESGRVILGTLDLDNQRLALEEIHRFANVPLKEGDSLHWDIQQIFGELETGLKKAGGRQLPIAGISTDSWGVDYVIFDPAGAILPPVFHYRDPRTARGVANAKAKVSWEEIFAETGIQFMPLNSIFQLAAESPERLQQAGRILMIGDAFNEHLSGRAVAEESLASTTQLYNPMTKAWSPKLLNALGLEARLFPPIVPSGTKLGPLQPQLADKLGLPAIEVVASCSHDTGAAVAAVPASGAHWAYLSSGTWSLMGVELGQPIITDACRDLNFTNEIGFGGSVRLLKNIIGLWLVQECRRDWAKAGQEYDYGQLTRMATEAAPFVSLINPMDPRFVSPENMPGRIADFCRETGQPVPVTPGAFVRCALESLALLYRRTLRQIETLTGNTIGQLHIVGGGSQNTLLNQLTANALQIPVLTGPVEATAAGNILVQAIALGHLPSLAAAREVVRHSMEVATVTPEPGTDWQPVYERFDKFF